MVREFGVFQDWHSAINVSLINNDIGMNDLWCTVENRTEIFFCLNILPFKITTVNAKLERTLT